MSLGVDVAFVDLGIGKSAHLNVLAYLMGTKKRR